MASGLQALLAKSLRASGARSRTSSEAPAWHTSPPSPPAPVPPLTAAAKEGWSLCDHRSRRLLAEEGDGHGRSYPPRAKEPLPQLALDRPVSLLTQWPPSTALCEHVSATLAVPAEWTSSSQGVPSAGAHSHVMCTYVLSMLCVSVSLLTCCVHAASPCATSTSHAVFMTHPCHVSRCMFHMYNCAPVCSRDMWPHAVRVTRPHHVHSCALVCSHETCPQGRPKLCSQLSLPTVALPQSLTIHWGC